MAEPTGAYTFNDLIIRVSEFIGISDYDTAGSSGTAGRGIAAIPEDAHDLDKVQRCINDAIKMFIADAPPTGWFWMERIMSITFSIDGSGADNIDGDSSRYLLAENFSGDVMGTITMAKDSDRGHIIDWCNEGHIRFLKETNEIDGYPRLAAIRPYSPTGSTLGSSRQFEFVIDPAPIAADTVEFPYRIGFNQLSEGTDLHPAGFRFDDSILSACKAQAEMEFDDLNAGWTERYHKVALPNAIKIDNRSRPRKLTRRHVLERTWNEVEFFSNGVQVDV